MRRMEDDCVDCGLPCLGFGCRYHGKHEHLYCDECEAEEVLYEVDGEELCLDCLLKRYMKKCDECGNDVEFFYSYDGKTICEDCLLEHFNKVEG